MSSDSDVAATVALYDRLNIDNYSEAAASVLLIYDALITLDREVAFFWSPKWTAASILFFANRWACLTLYVMVLVGFGAIPSDESCSLYNKAELALVALQFIPWAAFSALRAHVLSRSKLLGILVFVLSLAPVGANLVHYGYDRSGVIFQPYGCLSTDNTTVALNLKLTIISRVPLIVADMLLIYITWTQLSSRDALRDIKQSRRMSLSSILFRDGTIYFVILFVMNVLHLVLSATDVVANGDEASFLTVLTAPLTSTLVSRFLLELQAANHTVIKVDLDDPLHTSRDPYDSMPSFISSIGAFLNPDALAAAHVQDFERHIDSPLTWGEESETQVPEPKLEATA